jgi:hypothetical protein
LTQQFYTSLCWAAVMDSVLYLYEGYQENRWCEIVLAVAPQNTTLAELPACLSSGDCNRTQVLSDRLQAKGVLFKKLTGNKVSGLTGGIQNGRIIAVARDVPGDENHAILLLGFIGTPVSVIYFDPDSGKVGQLPFGDLGPNDQLFVTGGNAAPPKPGKPFDAYSVVETLADAQAALGEGPQVSAASFSQVLRIPGGERATRTLRRFFVAGDDAGRKLDDLDVSGGIRLARINWRQLAELNNLDSRDWWAAVERLGGLEDLHRVESRHLSFREGRLLGEFDCVDVKGRFDGRQVSSGLGVRSLVNALDRASHEVESLGDKFRSIWLLEIAGLRFSAIVVAAADFELDKVIPLAKAFDHKIEVLDRKEVEHLIKPRLLS